MSTEDGFPPTALPCQDNLPEGSWVLAKLDLASFDSAAIQSLAPEFRAGWGLAASILRAYKLLVFSLGLVLSETSETSETSEPSTESLSRVSNHLSVIYNGWLAVRELPGWTLARLTHTRRGRRFKYQGWDYPCAHAAAYACADRVADLVEKLGISPIRDANWKTLLYKRDAFRASSVLANCPDGAKLVRELDSLETACLLEALQTVSSRRRKKKEQGKPRPTDRPRLTIDLASNTVTLDGRRFENLDPRAVRLLDAVRQLDGRPRPKKEVRRRLADCNYDVTFDRWLACLPAKLRLLVHTRSGAGVWLQLPPPPML